MGMFLALKRWQAEQEAQLARDRAEAEWTLAQQSAERDFELKQQQMLCRHCIKFKLLRIRIISFPPAPRPSQQGEIQSESEGL